MLWKGRNGKTLLAVAAGLFMTGRQEFNGMTVSRPVVAMGDTLGFLPGTLNEKCIRGSNRFMTLVNS